VEKFSPEYVQKVTGIPSETLESAARLYASAKKRAIVFGSGVTQHLCGTDTVKALCNLALLTGETEEGGGGIFPMLTQNNAQGAFDMGAHSEFLPGYRKVSEEGARREFEEIWGKEIPAQPGYSYGEMFDRILEGRIKALYVFGEDPFITLPNLERLKSGLRQLEFLAVQDSFMTEIGRYAHVILPGVTFAEKEGTFTSMERRVQRVRQAIAPVGEARSDGSILCELSARMGYPMQYETPGAVMDEITRLVPSYAGMTYSELEKGGIQWPLNHGGQKKRFFPVEFKAPLEQPDDHYPLWIIPRGFHYHYGIGTTSKRAGGLAKVYEDSCIQIHPDDATRSGLKDGDSVKLLSPRGSIETLCRVSTDVPEGVAYYAGSFFPVPINDLLISDRDLVGHNPGYKVFVGRVEKRS
jgi:formate dehydrogenase major subunit